MECNIIPLLFFFSFRVEFFGSFITSSENFRVKKKEKKKNDALKKKKKKEIYGNAKCSTATRKVALAYSLVVRDPKKFKNSVSSSRQCVN